MCFLCGARNEGGFVAEQSFGNVSLTGSSPTPTTFTQAQTDALVNDAVNGRWTAGAPLGTSAFVTYSFITQVPAYDDPTERPGFQAFNQAQQVSARNALSAWAAVSGVTFLEVSGGREADITFGFHQFDGTAFSDAGGYAYLPGMSNGPWGTLSGDIYLRGEDYAGDTLATGFAFHTLLHEIGHALGLKHPFDGAVTLPYGEDTTQNTVMSYTGSGQSFVRPYDVNAIQYLYGTSRYSHFWDLANQALTIYGGVAAENIVASSVMDIVAAGAGNDTVFGEGGNDWLFGGAGTDVIWGGFGNDVLYGDLFAGEAGLDSLYGEAGNDILIGGMMLDLLEGGDGDDWLFGSGQGDSVRGGDGNDVAYGDLFAGESGIDTLEGGNGADTLIGGEDSDVIYGSFASRASETGHDWLFGSNGNDTIYASAGDDVLYGDLFAGETGQDLLLGEEGNDLILGGSGDDTLIGGAGTDQMYGEGGRDTFVIGLASDANADVIYDFTAGSGGDRIDLRGLGFSGMSFTTFVSGYLVQGGGGTTLDLDGAGTVQHILLVGVNRTTLTAENFLF